MKNQAIFHRSKWKKKYYRCLCWTNKQKKRTIPKKCLDSDFKKSGMFESIIFFILLKKNQILIGATKTKTNSVFFFQLFCRVLFFKKLFDFNLFFPLFSTTRKKLFIFEKKEMKGLNFIKFFSIHYERKKMIHQIFIFRGIWKHLDWKFLNFQKKFKKLFLTMTMTCTNHQPNLTQLWITFIVIVINLTSLNYESQA